MTTRRKARHQTTRSHQPPPYPHKLEADEPDEFSTTVKVISLAIIALAFVGAVYLAAALVRVLR